MINITFTVTYKIMTAVAVYIECIIEYFTNCNPIGPTFKQVIQNIFSFQ